MGASLELVHSRDCLFDPISELLFFGHVGFYRMAAPTHRGIIADSKYSAVSANVRPQQRLTTYIATFHASFSRPLTLRTTSSRATSPIMRSGRA